MVKCYIKDIIKNLTIKSLVNFLANDIFVSKNQLVFWTKEDLASTLGTGKKSKIFIAALLSLCVVGTTNAFTRYSVAPGSWDSPSTWSASSGGASGASVPIAGDIVFIEGNNTVSTTAAAACTDVNIATGSALTIGGSNFTSTGTVTVNGTLTYTSRTGTKTFANVVISGGGTWTSNAAETYTMNNLILSGSTINGASTGIFAVSGNMAVTSGTTNVLNQLSITVAGTTTFDGTTNILSRTGTKIFTGLVTINSTGIINNTSVNESLTFRGGITNNGGTFNAGTGVQTFDTNSQALNGTLVIPSVTVTGVTLTNNGTLTVQTALSGTGGLTNAATGTLNIGGTSGITTLTATVAGNTVNFTSAAQTVKATTYSNLILSGSGAKTTTGVTVNGILSMEGTATASAVPTYGAAATLQYKGSALQTTDVEFPATFNGTGGLIIDNPNGVTLGAARTIGAASKLMLANGVLTTTGTNLLSITNTATTAISGGSTTAYISGPVSWTLPASLASGSTYNFPVGNTTYLPFSLVNPTTGTGPVTARVEAFSASSGGSFDATLGAISTSEYWSLITSGNFTNSSVSASRQTAISPLNAIAASTALAGTYSTLGGSVGTYGVTASNSIGTNRYFLLGQGIPYINTSLTTLTGFTYPSGTGPSVEQFLTVSGSSLTDNVVIVPPADYEISLTSGSGFQSTSISLPISNGFVSTTTIYVRLKAGLAINTYNSEIISLTSTGATAKTVACSGSVSSAPSIIATPSSLTGFVYTYNSSTSAAQSFTVSGTSLVGDVTVTPPSDYEISTGTTYQATPITLAPTSGTLTSTTINVRLKLGLGVGSHIQNVVVTATGATTQNVSCSGTVNPAPTIYNDISILSGFVYSTTTGGPSGTQTFNVSGSNLTAPIVLTPQANYEISLTSGSGYVSTTTGTKYLSIAPTGGTVSPTTIYVRLKSGLTAGNYNLVSIILTSTGGITKSVTCSGSVVSAATLTTSKVTLTGFGYLFANGPSSEQSFSVSGTALGTNNLTVTPSANFEISTGTGASFVATNPITLTPVSGSVTPTVIYVRLKSGLVANPYGPENVVVAAAGSGASAINVSCAGKVFASPLISAGATGTPSCPNSTINLSSTGADIQTRYWQGPNNFYSTDQNPVLATNNSTIAMTGTYTVTGNVVVGGNLVTNGDFESGNTSFGSAYGYVTPATNALYPEGLYSIVSSPQSVHNNFTTNGDNTPAPGTMQMVVNGSPTPGVVVWSQSVQVIPGATYQFTYWEQTVCLPSPSILQLYVNGVAAGPAYTASSTAAVWTHFLYNAAAGTNTVLNLELVNQNTIAGGNDFALDDIVFQQILSADATVDVLVNNSLPASVSIVASATNVVQGATVSYTATPTNGGDTPTYQWKVGGVNAGTNSSVFSYVPANGDQVTCTMTSSLACGTSATSNTITMTVTQPANYWRGTNGTDWGTATNWTAGYVPSPGENVIYASAGNSYGSDAINDLVLDQNRTIGSLINATTKRLVIPAAKGLTVNNTITTDNNPDRIYIHCDSLTSNGSLIFHNSSASPVYATVEMYSKASSDTAQAAGNKYNWQYFGIPIQSVVAQPAFNGSYVRKWDEKGTAINNHWVQLDNSSVLLPFYGYELCQAKPKVIYFKGKLVNSNFNSGQLAFTYYGTGNVQNALFPGQHIFANPYTSAIDIRQLVFGSQTEASVYLYNTGTYNSWTNGGQTTPGVNPGQYTVSTKNTAGAGGLPRQVPSMGAMLVKAMSNSSQATFGITYNSVAMFNTDLQRVSSLGNVSSDKIYTKIDVSSANGGDRMWIFSEPACSRNFDNGWDGAKMLGSSLSPQLYALEPDGNYQVNVVDDMNSTDLAFQSGSDVEYTLTFTHENVKRYYPGVYLVDRVENKIVDVTETGSQYKFLAESTPKPANRFQIVTRYYEKDTPDETSNIKIFSSKGMIFVHNFSSHNGNAMIFDISGHFVTKVPFSANGITILNSGIAPGAYVAKCLTETDKVTERIIVR